MPTVYLTFDDGPLAGTDDVIDVLNQKRVKGSLLIGILPPTLNRLCNVL